MCKILFIDNSQQFEPSIRSVLAGIGMDASLHGVRDGRAALRFLEEGNKVDIIFSDIDQPSSGGIEFYRRITPDYPRVKRIVVTSSKCFEVAKHVVNLQLNGYVSKPIDTEEIVTLLEMLAPEAFYQRQYSEKLGRKERDELAKRRLVGEVLSIIEQEVDRDISLYYIAQKVHISACYLSALFQEVMGQGLIRYITEYRMNMAASLLTKSNLRIFEVAERVGYRSAPYFCTVFKNKYQMTPSQFREVNYIKAQ